MMKKHLLALSAAAVLLAPQTVGAEGFGLNEWSAEGMAMGGARMFAENDAANFAYNPASMTKVQGEKFKVSATYLSPHGKYKTYGAHDTYDYNGVTKSTGTFCQSNGDPNKLTEAGRNRIHPGWVPGSYYVKQLNDKDWIGMGLYSRFGNACQFEAGSVPGTNNTSAKINGISMGINYARKIDKKWAASLGAEVNYVDLQMDKTPGFGAGHIHVEGETYALGWNAAVNYAFDDKNEMGVVYRSAINHSMDAEYDAHGAALMATGGVAYGDAYGQVTLPESVMIGYGHKFNDKTRVELNGTWTRWSRFDKLNIMNETLGVPLSFSDKNWSDGWRYAIGLEHKLSDKYSLLAGIAHDESSIPDNNGADFMIPTGTRTTFSIGTQYHDDRQTLALAIGYMKVGDLSMKGDPAHGDGYTNAKMYDSYTKMFSISYQYNF